MQRTTSNNGFALFELLLAAILLCGLTALLITFIHTQHRRLATQGTGRDLARVFNDFIINAQPRDCAAKTLADCTKMKKDMQKILKNDGVDPKNATVSVDNENSKVSITFNGKYTASEASTYASVIYNALSQQALWKFTPSMKGVPFHYTLSDNNNRLTFVLFYDLQA